MYDLPVRFTYGVVRSYMAACAAPAAAVPDEELRYPGHQHSAEWWLFKDLRRRGPRDRPVARVDDPADADLFYVPFVSSLSLVVNPIRPSTAAAAANASAGAAYSDESAQEELMEWLERQPYWRRHRGRDHVFICQDPNARCTGWWWIGLAMRCSWSPTSGGCVVSRRLSSRMLSCLTRTESIPSEVK